MSAFSTFNDAVLKTGGARLLLFVSVFDVATTTSVALAFVVVVAGEEVVVIVLVVEPAIGVAIDEMLTVIAILDDVTVADEADVKDEVLEVVTGAAVDTFSLARDSLGFGDAFTFDAVEFVCDKPVGAALIKSVINYRYN